MRRNTVETDECGEPASKSERVLLVVTFKKKKKKIKINRVDVGGREEDGEG